MYSTKPSIVLGFHGCDRTRLEKLLKSKDGFHRSEEVYDWLGHGMYFWEGNYERAKQWAIDRHKDEKKACVIGAVIDLGVCLDLIDSKYLKILQNSYSLLSQMSMLRGKPLPENNVRPENNTTLLKKLDCAVIENIHTNMSTEENSFDSVRGVFWEGSELYPGTDHREENHIQICVRNPNCIKGFFLPRELDGDWRKVN